MKILWFSLSPCGSIRRNSAKHVVQGWMISLEDAIKKYTDIELAVAYHSNKEESPFIFDAVKYYPIFNCNKNMKQKIMYQLGAEDYNIDELKCRLASIVRDFTPDIIHIHGTESFYGLVSEIITNIPVVYSIQGLLCSCYEKLYEGLPYSFLEGDQRISDFIGASSLRQKDMRYRRNRDREIRYLKNARFIIGRTDWDRKICKLFNSNIKYYVVNEILRRNFYESTWKGSLSKGKFFLLSTISPGLFKGYETLLKTAKILTDLNVDFVWDVVGLSDSDNYTLKSEKFVGISHAECNVVLHGRQDADVLSSMLKDTDIYCHVSHIENSPNAVCEAMLVGVPIIASFAGGTSSILYDGIEGVLVQNGDPYIMAAAINDMISNENFAVSCAEAARRRAIQRHNPTRVIRELVEVYQSIVTVR